MASTDMVHEVALYLEYFLKGLSDCNVVGSYTVQFLELRGFSVRLEASLANHLIRLVANIKGLLMKFDHSFRPFSNVEVQTEISDLCSSCSSQRSYFNSFKTSPLHGTSSSYEDSCVDKTYGHSEVAQTFNSNPLLQIKEELPSLKLRSLENTIQCKKKRLQTTVSHVGNSKCDFSSRSSEITREKCIVDLHMQNALNDVSNEGSTSSHQGDGQGEILLDHMDDSDTASSEGLMYSVYSMDSRGSLQLVSRILSKTNMMRENWNHPVERAMIEINSMKEEHLENTVDSAQDKNPNVNVEEFPAPDSPGLEGNARISGKTVRGAKALDIKSTDDVLSFGSVVTDIVKLGPEDLESATWCGICEAELPSTGSLKTHISRMHSKVKCCHTCNKTIKSEDMSVHVQECHSELPYVCSVCGQSLRTNAGYQRHMDIHKGVRGNACEICGRTFSRMEYYRDHKRIHTGEKPYECHTCKKTFSRSSNLHTHMRIHNSEEERYTCNVCFKSFARTDKLKDHMIRHLQIKRYACRLCSKSYNEKRDLIKHIDKIHSNDTDCGTD